MAHMIFWHIVTNEKPEREEKHFSHAIFTLKAKSRAFFSLHTALLFPSPDARRAFYCYGYGMLAADLFSPGGSSIPFRLQSNFACNRAFLWGFMIYKTASGSVVLIRVCRFGMASNSKHLCIFPRIRIKEDQEMITSNWQTGKFMKIENLFYLYSKLGKSYTK